MAFKLETCPAFTEGRREEDFYPTPRWPVIAYLDAMDSRLECLAASCRPGFTVRGRPAPLTIVEPCAGDGAIVEVLLERGYPVSAFELRKVCGPPLMEVAYRSAGPEYDFHVGIDWLRHSQGLDLSSSPILGNPPFCLALEFVQSCLATGSPHVALLLRLGFLASLKRAAFNNDCPVTQLLVLGKRPDFTGGGGDNSDYAWFVWEPGAQPRAPLVLQP